MLPTQYASFVKRLVAFIIDVIITLVLAAVIGSLVVVFVPPLHVFIRSAGCFPDPGFGLADEIFPPLIFFAFTMFHKVLCWLYFALFQSSPRQATPGKMMLGLFVTDINGRRISFLRALGRALGRELSQIICWLGYVLALFTARKQTLHDMVAGTLVLEPAYPAPMMAAPQADYPGRANVQNSPGIAAGAKDEKITGKDGQPDDKPEQENR